MSRKYIDKTLDFTCKLDAESPLINFEIKISQVKALIDHLNNAMLRELQFQQKNKHISCKQ